MGPIFLGEDQRMQIYGNFGGNSRCNSVWVGNLMTSASGNEGEIVNGNLQTFSLIWERKGRPIAYCLPKVVEFFEKFSLP